jgi:phage tail sheath protein FI
MKRAVKVVALAIAVYAVATRSGRERLKRAREAYSKKVASGSKPIEGVGTAVAAFVGLAASGTLNTPRSPGVYVEEVPTPPRPIEGVGTSTAARVSDDPEEPKKPGKSGVLHADD